MDNLALNTDYIQLEPQAVSELCLVALRGLQTAYIKEKDNFLNKTRSKLSNSIWWRFIKRKRPTKQDTQRYIESDTSVLGTYYEYRAMINRYFQDHELISDLLISAKELGQEQSYRNRPKIAQMNISVKTHSLLLSYKKKAK